MDNISAIRHNSTVVITGAPSLAVQPQAQPGGRDSGEAIDFVALKVARQSAQKVVDIINDAASAIDLGAKLVIRKDDGSGRFVYEFRNPTNNDLVRQFPAEDVLRALSAFKEAAVGKTLDQKA